MLRLWFIFFARKIKNINENNIEKIKSFPRKVVPVKIKAADDNAEQTPESHKYIV